MIETVKESVEVTKSISGAYWRMKYRGKVAFEEDEPTEAQKVKFKASVDRQFAESAAAARIGSGSQRGATVTQAER